MREKHALLHRIGFIFILGEFFPFTKISNKLFVTHFIFEMEFQEVDVAFIYSTIDQVKRSIQEIEKHSHNDTAILFVKTIANLLITKQEDRIKFKCLISVVRSIRSSAPNNFDYSLCNQFGRHTKKYVVQIYCNKHIKRTEMLRNQMIFKLLLRIVDIKFCLECFISLESVSNCQVEL